MMRGSRMPYSLPSAPVCQWGGMIFRILAGLRHGGGRLQHGIIPLINREWPTSPDRLRPGPGCPEIWSGNKNNPEKGRPSPPLYRSGIRQACSIYRISSIRTSAASPAAFIPSRRHDADDTREQGPDCTPEPTPSLPQAPPQDRTGFAGGTPVQAESAATYSSRIHSPAGFLRPIPYPADSGSRLSVASGRFMPSAIKGHGGGPKPSRAAQSAAHSATPMAPTASSRSHFSLCIQLSIAATSAQRKAGSPHPSSICRW